MPEEIVEVVGGNKPAALVEQDGSDSEAWNADGLTVREKLFVEYFCNEAGGNIAKAAEMAGYSANSATAIAGTGHSLMRRTRVQQAIAILLNKKSLTVEWAQGKLVQIASSDMTNFADVDENGNFRLDYLKARNQAALGQIKKITEKVIKRKSKEPMKSEDGTSTQYEEVVIERTLELHDPTKALEMILRLAGLLKKESHIVIEGREGVTDGVKRGVDYAKLEELYRNNRSIVARSTVSEVIPTANNSGK